LTVVTVVTDGTASSARPPAPTTLEETGLTEDLVTGLVLKSLHAGGPTTGLELSKRLGLVFGVIEPILGFLKTQLLCEIVGGGMIGGATYRYRLSDAGHQRARSFLQHNSYCGIAPITLDQYRRYMDQFNRSMSRGATNEQVRDAFSHLVVAEAVLDELGPAINAGHSIFIYGPPGNGKSAMAAAVRTLLGGTIAMPYALEVDGHIIRFFDPAIHEPIPASDLDEQLGERYDGRWIVCRRPMVSVGGELTLEALGLSYNARSGMYRAPVQALANGGVLVIDDFGRQRCAPRDLLNWWMVPLESGVEYLMLESGEKFEMPFLALVIFSTNLSPSDLVDEAFLRRIQYKIYARNPTVEGFIRIFERCCDERGIAFQRPLVEDLIDAFYRPRRIELRACQPRDLINQALTLASYRGQPRQLTAELLDAACASYFVDRREARRDAVNSEVAPKPPSPPEETLGNARQPPRTLR
jgi:predicted ATPase with chaperone activity